MNRADNPLVRAIGRVPTTVQRKLLVALAIVAVLLVTVGLLASAPSTRRMTAWQR